MRIKKKEVVLPFRNTLAYRMILLTGSIIVFIIALSLTVAAMSQANTTRLIVTGAVAVLAAVAAVYNLGHLHEAKIPKQTLNRMKRR